MPIVFSFSSGTACPFFLPDIFPPFFQAEGEVLASHGDGTFTVKYLDGQTEDDVPEACLRSAAGRRERRRGQRGFSGEDRRRT